MAIHAVVSSAWTDPKPSIFVVFNSIKEVFADLYKTKKKMVVSTAFSSSPAIYTTCVSTTCQKYSNSKPVVVKTEHVKCIATKNVDKRSATNYLKLM